MELSLWRRIGLFIANIFIGWVWAVTSLPVFVVRRVLEERRARRTGEAG